MGATENKFCCLPEPLWFVLASAVLYCITETVYVLVTKHWTVCSTVWCSCFGVWGFFCGDSLFSHLAILRLSKAEL